MATPSPPRKKLKIATDNPYHSIPHDVFLEVLYRLPVKSLIRCSSVCKLWFKSIVQYPKFVSSHFLHSRKKPLLLFKFQNRRISKNYPYYFGKNSINHFFYLKKDGVFDLTKITTIKSEYSRELVGYCNGFVCFRMGLVTEIFNPSRREILAFFSAKLSQEFGVAGFGFDSLSEKYKVLYLSKRLKRCMIFTLGTNSWTKISNRLLGRLCTSNFGASIFCNGALFWKTTDPHEMIWFDLHDEKFDVIRIPDECVSKRCYQLEFKGKLCFARVEKLGTRNCEVHLHVLYTKIKQEWIKETIIIPYSPPCKRNTTGIIGFNDQVLLCWYVGQRPKHFRFYNLHTKDVKEVKNPGVDYHVISHVENFLSLRTFMQDEGASGLCYFADSYPQLEFIAKQRPRTPGVFLCLGSLNHDIRASDFEFYF